MPGRHRANAPAILLRCVPRQVMRPMMPFPIFKPGCFAASSGDRLCFSDADLQDTARAYRPQLRPAPLVLGHPADDRPVQGWVSGLRYRDGQLVAEPEQLAPAFVDLVKRGRYKKVSAAFHTPYAPENPVPGSFYLKHVGFLGAAAPAVRGLAAPAFCECLECGDLVRVEPIGFAEASGPVDEYELLARELALQERERQLALQADDLIAQRASEIYMAGGVSTEDAVRLAEREIGLSLSG